MKIKIVLFCLFVLTPLRSFFILLAPFVVVGVFKMCGKKRWNGKMTGVLCLFVWSSFWGLTIGTIGTGNFVLSLWITLPLLLFLVSPLSFEGRDDIVKYFIKYTTRILLFVNALGLLLGFILGFYSDFMTRSYGGHFAGMNGLAMLNVTFIIYFFHYYYFTGRKKYLYLSLSFLIGLISCECGLVIICMVLTSCLIFLFKLRWDNIIKTVIAILILVLIINHFSQDVEYYRNNIDFLLNSEIWESNFRKMVAFADYVNVVNDNLCNFLFGVGPGGYNGRIAFLLNNDASNPFTYLLGHSMPEYHTKFIYPLWDKQTLDMAAFNDGSRNKPFSSCLSILAEYGIFMFGIVSYSFYKWYKRYKNAKMKEKGFVILFISVFLYFMLLFDQWFETSEMFFLILLIKMLNTASDHEYKLNKSNLSIP